MTGLNRLPHLLLALALGLSSAACGDDDEKKGNDGSDGSPDGADGADGEDGGDDGEDGGSDWDGVCAAGGIFEGSSVEDVQGAVKASGACIGETDVAPACQYNVSAIAGTAGRDCFAVDEEYFEECVRTGDGGPLEGIQDKVPGISDECTNCYVGSVVCSRQNCLADCLDSRKEQECTACRIAAGCTAAFYACSGFPTPDELTP